MTVAEKIKRSTKPFSIERWVYCWRQKLIFKLKSYDKEGETGIQATRIEVWDFQFIDGSKITCRMYW